MPGKNKLSKAPEKVSLIPSAPLAWCADGGWEGVMCHHSDWDQSEMKTLQSSQVLTCVPTNTD